MTKQKAPDLRSGGLKKRAGIEKTIYKTKAIVCD